MTTQITVAVVALWLLLQQRLYAVDAFSARGPSSSLINRGCCGNSRRTSSATDLLVVCWATPQVELAAALTEYLAKAHEEKLRAVQEVQSQKDEQIMSLKKAIAELQEHPSQSASSSSSIVFNGSSSPSSAIELQQKVVELETKLRAYQDFVAKYIVDAQYQKMLAVKAAEADVTKKLQAQLHLGGGATPSPPPPSIATATTLDPTTENALYLERNARVAEAAKAGKSRWGDLEVQRAASQQVAASPATAINGASATVAAPVPVPAEVQEADHGLRAEGSVGGWSLAERVALGAKAGSATFVVNGSVAVPATAPFATAPPSLYQLRNAKVVAAGKAGKSRWGEQELARVSQLVASMPAVTSASAPVVASGDRVNIGAKLLGKQ